jgi:hypothetical protein
MNYVTFKPIFKHGKIDKSSSANYRAIAYGSLFFKIFELVFKDKFLSLIQSSSQQFGYKKNLSSHICSWVLKEVVRYFLLRGSFVYACFVDCSKAFDNVNYAKLFRLLVQRGVDQSYIRFLHYIYVKQKGRVEWGDALSNTFSIKMEFARAGFYRRIYLLCISMKSSTRLKIRALGALLRVYIMVC